MTITIKEMSEKYKISDKTLYAAGDRGALKVIKEKRGARHVWRVDVREAERYAKYFFGTDEI